MKMLKDGSMAFYYSRWKCLSFAIIFLILGIVFFLFTAEEWKRDYFTSTDGWILLIFLFIFCFFTFCLFYQSFGIKPYVKLNDDYIERKSLPPVLWEDIDEVFMEDRYVSRHITHQFLFFKLRGDMNFYGHKLSFIQKHLIIGRNTFSVDMDLLSKNDQDALWAQVIRRIKYPQLD
jgi:hypothetical protein